MIAVPLTHTPLYLGFPACTMPGLNEVGMPLPAQELKCVSAEQRTRSLDHVALVRDLASGNTLQNGCSDVAGS